MKKLAQELLNDLNKMSMDNMDDFDKYDYFKSNMQQKILELCNTVLDDSPKVIDVMDIQDLSNIEEQIQHVYEQNDVCMGEVLASTGVNNISLEDAMELYAKIMHNNEGDNFVQFYNGARDFENDNFRFIGE